MKRFIYLLMIDFPLILNGEIDVAAELNQKYQFHEEILDINFGPGSADVEIYFYSWTKDDIFQKNKKPSNIVDRPNNQL